MIAPQNEFSRNEVAENRFVLKAKQDKNGNATWEVIA